MRWERGNAPIVHATHGNSSCKRGRLGAPASASRRAVGAPPRAFCLWGSTGARQHVYASQSWLQRPQTLMNNPTHRLLKKKFAQEQRRQRKKGAPRPRAHLHAGGPNRALPSPRKRLDAGARTCRGSTCIAKTSYKTAAAFPWPARAAPFCAKMPAPATGSLLHLGCHFARFRHTHRSLPFACERFAGSATQPDYCETRPLGVRVAGQERLSGTALRYGS
jgi:hypothetical protein